MSLEGLLTEEHRPFTPFFLDTGTSSSHGEYTQNRHTTSP